MFRFETTQASGRVSIGDFFVIENTSSDSYVEQTRQVIDVLKSGFEGLFDITLEENITREKGYYGVLYARPARRIRVALSIEREILVLVSTFSDQQARTIQTAREIIVTSGGRLEGTTFIVAHKDARGNAKLKAWGREQGFAVLPIHVGHQDMPRGQDMLRLLAHELFSHDPFDVTGPVADDTQFYGRREEARELAKRLQTGQIRTCFGIRKIGKTSILHRVIHDMRENYDCVVILVDCQRDSVFALSAASLLNSLAAAVENGDQQDYLGHPINPTPELVQVEVAAERLLKAVLDSTRPVIVVFDEIDFITPGSPNSAFVADGIQCSLEKCSSGLPTGHTAKTPLLYIHFRRV
jgi:hypothetical protein